MKHTAPTKTSRTSPLSAASNGNPSHPSKPVGIWIRVSTEDQAQGESPAHHETRARMYAEVKGWAVVRVYDLSGVSGKSVWDHPECKAMLSDVAAGRISALIFSKLARLARNTTQLLAFAEHFKTHGADLVSLHEAIDTSTPAGRLFYTMNAALAEWEREEIAERVRASVPVRAKLGKPLGGAAPFGYRWDDGRLVLDPVEAPVRRLAFELFREHRRVLTTARLLNEAGYRTRTGAKFSTTTVKRLLTDPLAKGLRRANYTQSLGQKKHWTTKPEAEWVYVEAPAVVSEVLWDEVNATLAEQAASRKPHRMAVHLFSGLAYCHCGAKMRKPSNTPKYVCPWCRNKIPEHDLELVFAEQLKGFFLDPAEIAAHLEANDRVLDEKRSLLASLEAERAGVEREMGQIYRAYIAGSIPSETFGALYVPLEERQGALLMEAPRLQGEIDALALAHSSTEIVVEDARTLYGHWSELAFEEKRLVVETIVERITVGERTVDIDLAFVPAALPESPSDPLRDHSPHHAPRSPQVVALGEHNLTGSSKPRA